MTDPLARFHRTGRTTRAVAEAINLAEAGYYVFFVTGSASPHHTVLHLLSTAMRAGTQPKDVGCAKVYIGSRGGSVQVMHVQSTEFNSETLTVRGAHPSCRVVIDPNAMEYMFGLQLRAYHKYDKEPTDEA